jgi:hypothetical protein
MARVKDITSTTPMESEQLAWFVERESTCVYVRTVGVVVVTESS